MRQQEPKLPRALEGIRVLELGQLLAGPFAGTILAYHGADVIKVEPPGRGDPIRQWRVLADGTSLWWRSLGRNKRCVTCDLKTERGRELARELALQSDVLIENFRPGTLEAWGLGPAALWEHNPALVIARVSGYGQTGPYADRPGFASVCEGFGGFRHLNGMPGAAPVRPNLSMGDTLAGLHAALGIMLALRQRDADPEHRGQVVDVALFEAVFNLLEAVVPEYDGAGVSRGPSGTTVTGIVPTNTYPCQDGRYVIIGGNGDSIYKRLMETAGRADLAHDPRLADNAGRLQHQREIDQAIAAWTAGLNSDTVLEKLRAARVPAGPIYRVEDMFADPQYQARALLETVEVDGKSLRIPAIVPRMEATPGRTEWAGPSVGAHNREIFGELLGLGEAEQAALKDAGII